MSELGRCSGVGRCSGERTAPAAGRLAADWLKMEEGAPPFVRRPCARACSRRCMCSERMKPSMPDPSIDAETLGTESRGSESREPQKEEGAEGRWRVLWPAVIMIALAADLSRRDEPGGSLGLPPSPPLLPHRFGEPRAAEAEAQAAAEAAAGAETAEAEVAEAEAVAEECSSWRMPRSQSLSTSRFGKTAWQNSKKVMSPLCPSSRRWKRRRASEAV
mmetsp:Transcript_19786/g.66816  ORF Transcript_19786/g.66816 Transcript_19786/m.66816 type:complete len:218 (-) Transcript_19786:1560-2213(-)